MRDRNTLCFLSAVFWYREGGDIKKEKKNVRINCGKVEGTNYCIGGLFLLHRLARFDQGIILRGRYERTLEGLSRNIQFMAHENRDKIITISFIADTGCTTIPMNNIL